MNWVLKLIVLCVGELSIFLFFLNEIFERRMDFDIPLSSNPIFFNIFLLYLFVMGNFTYFCVKWICKEKA